MKAGGHILTTIEETAGKHQKIYDAKETRGREQRTAGSWGKRKKSAEQTQKKKRHRRKRRRNVNDTEKNRKTRGGRCPPKEVKVRHRAKTEAKEERPQAQSGKQEKKTCQDDFINGNTIGRRIRD